MPEHNNNNDKERELSGEVTETTSSDAYIERALATIQSEIEDTGETIEIPSGDIHRPRLISKANPIVVDRNVEGPANALHSPTKPMVDPDFSLVGTPTSREVMNLTQYRAEKASQRALKNKKAA